MDAVKNLLLMDHLIIGELCIILIIFKRFHLWVFNYIEIIKMPELLNLLKFLGLYSEVVID